MVHAISVSVSATEFISRFFIPKHVYAIILYLDQTHYEWPSLFLDQTLFITYFEFKGLTFSWKNEQWKCTVLPDIDSRCKSFLLSVLWTTTCSRNGIPTGLKTTWQRDGWNTLYTQWKFLCKISFSEISNCHHLILQQFFHEKNIRPNSITLRFITFQSKIDFLWYFFQISSAHCENLNT